MKKNIFTLLLAVAMVFSVMAVATSAEVTGLRGTGTEGDPYLISTLDELKWFRDDVNAGNQYTGKYVKLTADIDMGNAEWTPIGPSGDSSNKFYGIFDGQNHTIKNLYVKQGAAYHAAGLFGATCGTVKNLIIDGAYVESLSSGSATVNGTAVLAGSTAYGADIENVHVKNATVKGNRYVAGIVGYMDGTVKNCSVENVTIIATPDDLTGSYDNGDKVGGIVGYTNSNATEISGCELKGEVSITGYRDIGGLVGSVLTTVTVSDNTNNADVSITVDQKTGYYADKDANAGEFIGRGTASDSSANNNRGTDAEYTTTVSDNNVAQIGTVRYKTLQAALDAAKDETDIVIDLCGDAVLDITAWQTLAIGGESTETITINGNGYTLTFNKLNSDWNHVATNNGAKLILNNMTITDSGRNDGPWNRYDIVFACAVELNNVTSTKALAFKADATLNTVAITEVKDAYAIWVQANGQTVEINGLTVNSAGRGIKIDEEYEDAVKVNLSITNATFTTAKKAAILIKSEAGATINVGANVDITNVAADSTNVVWNDSASAAHYGTIEVIGGTMAQEDSADFVVAITKDGDVVGYYTTLQAAIDAAVNGETVTLLADTTLDTTVTVANGTTVVLDLNGNTITGTDTTTSNFGLINNNGTLTINDSVGGGAITLTATNDSGWARYSAVIANNVGGTLVVNGGTIEHLGGTSMAYGIDSLTNSGLGDVSVTVNGGTVKSSYIGIRQFLNCYRKNNVLVINGGTVEGVVGSVFVQSPSANVNKGSITVTDEATLNGDVYIYGDENAADWDVTVSISVDAIGENAIISDGLPEGYEVVCENGYYAVDYSSAVDGDYAGVDSIILCEDELTVEFTDYVVENAIVTVNGTEVDVTSGSYTFTSGAYTVVVTNKTNNEEIDSFTVSLQDGHSMKQEYGSIQHWKKCSHCGYTDNIGYHNWTYVTTLEQATETTTGTDYYLCYGCGAADYRTTPVLGHTHVAGEEWKHDELRHWHECSCGEVSDLAGHVWNDGVETEDAMVYTCTVCGQTKTGELPAHVHTAGSEYKYNDTHHWNECECGEVMNESTHLWVTDKVENGTIYSKCVFCDATVETPEQTDSYDDESVSFMLPALVMSIVAVGFATLMAKKKNN